MDENLDELHSDLAGINSIRSCYKYNKTISNQIEPCDSLINKENSCFAIWELNDQALSKSAVNLTEVSETSKLSLKGCFSGQEPKPTDRTGLLCSFKPKPKNTLICYCKDNNCNQKDLPSIELLRTIQFQIDNPYAPPPLPSPRDQPNLNVAYLVGGLISVLIFFLLLFKFIHRRKNFNKQLAAHDLSANEKSYENRTNPSDLCLPEHQEPLLPNKPLGPHQLRPQIISTIKKGEFCSVYKGVLDDTHDEDGPLALVHPGQEQTVAVKAYRQQAYEQFKHEYFIYSLPELKHENILRLLGFEERQIVPPTLEYCLIFDYYENGSLYEYLKSRTVSFPELLKICLGIAAGLAHLHNSDGSIVVHRDIKSKNVLLRSDLTACISDFNLAIVLYKNQPAPENLDQSGTVRYMSPEVLDCAIQFSKEGLMKIDIYSTALVFWELLSRCTAHSGPFELYKMPYEEEFGRYLMQEELRRHVSDNKKRPEMPEHWFRDNKYLAQFQMTIKESWDSDPEARLTASGILERLKMIKAMFEIGTGRLNACVTG